jgi:hypothetical protein
MSPHKQKKNTPQSPLLLSCRFSIRVRIKSIKGKHDENRQSVFSSFSRHLFSPVGRGVWARAWPCFAQNYGNIVSAKKWRVCDEAIASRPGAAHGEKIKGWWRHYISIHHYKSCAEIVISEHLTLVKGGERAPPHKKRISSKSQRYLCRISELFLFLLLWARLEIKTREQKSTHVYFALFRLIETFGWGQVMPNGGARWKKFECTPLFVEWIRALRGKSIH